MKQASSYTHVYVYRTGTARTWLENLVEIGRLPNVLDRRNGFTGQRNMNAHRAR